jgi:hypothetical protein
MFTATFIPKGAMTCNPILIDEDKTMNINQIDEELNVLSEKNIDLPKIEKQNTYL